MPITSIEKFVYAPQNRLGKMPDAAIQASVIVRLIMKGMKVSRSQERAAAQDAHTSATGEMNILEYEKAHAKTILTHKNLSELDDEISAQLDRRFGVNFLSKGGGVSDVQLCDYQRSQGFDDRWVIGQVYSGDSRFLLKERSPTGVDIYEKRGSTKQYVRDSYENFVVRYVRRNLSRDFKNTPQKTLAGLAQDGLVASKAVPNPITAQHILDHLRKGSTKGSPFFSFTTTKHKIYGSKGEAFYRPVNGKVLVDLAALDKTKIIDVHSWEALEDVLSVGSVELLSKNSKSWGAKGIQGNEKQKQLAARDTIRTREVLIAGNVPAASIVSIKVGDDPWRDLAANVTVVTNALPQWVKDTHFGW